MKKTGIAIISTIALGFCIGNAFAQATPAFSITRTNTLAWPTSYAPGQPAVLSYTITNSTGNAQTGTISGLPVGVIPVTYGDQGLPAYGTIPVCAVTNNTFTLSDPENKPISCNLKLLVTAPLTAGMGSAIVSNQNGLTTSIDTNSFTIGNRNLNRLFAAVGDNGGITSSADLVNWAVRTPGTDNNLYSVATNGSGQYVAVGDNGTILLGTANTAGMNWVPQANGDAAPQNNLHSVVYGNSHYVAVGDNGLILSSTDGTNWLVDNAADSGLFGCGGLYNVTYGNGQFVAVGGTNAPCGKDNVKQNVNTGKIVFVSADGYYWTQSYIDTSDGQLNSVTYGNTVDNVSSYVAVGNGYNTTAYGGFILTGIYNSVSHVWSWNSSHTDTSTGALNSVAYDNSQGQYVAVGSSCNINLGQNGCGSLILTSPNASTWTVRYTNTNGGQLNKVAYGYTIPGSPSTSYFVAVGNTATAAGDLILTLTYSNSAWTPTVSHNDTTNGGRPPLNDIIYYDFNGSYYWLAVGNSGSIYEGSFTPAGNPQWVWNSVGNPDGDYFGCNLSSVIPGLVTVGDCGVVMTSQYGDEWTLNGVTGDYQFKSVTYNGSEYVAVGSSGVIATSSDGMNWTFQPNPDWGDWGYDLYSVSYGAGVFVATGDRGITMSSPDGANWTVQANPIWNDGTVETAALNGVVYSGTQFVAVGYNSNNNCGDKSLLPTCGAAILTSPDGVNWYEAYADDQGPALNSIAYNGTTYVAVGGNSGTPKEGYILTSQDGVTWDLPSNPDLSNANLTSVIYDGTQFVAVGNNTHTVILTSSDGIIWALNTPALGSAVWTQLFYTGTTQYLYGMVGNLRAGASASSTFNFRIN